MPELPDLEIIKEVLQRRLVGQRIEGVAVLRPVVLRILEPQLSAEAFLVGRAVREVARRAKFLLFTLDDGGWVAINPMLAGRLRLCPRAERLRTRDYLTLHLANGEDLRYHDLEGMGKVYLTHDLALVPTWSELGPEATDPALTAAVWLERLARYSGEAKGVLTRGALVAGIGNAYADEILFQAGLYPFRKVSSLSVAERLALYEAMRAVLGEAVATLRERVGDEIHTEVRDFLRVHNRKGQPCPRCGQAISEIKTEGRATDFCRRCQPGSLLRQ
jgi:formamidopyrimidine-DNA glycosylase